ncbi:MAG: protein translocase subunit SecF [Candidatus Moraniibacteriota bacterium]|nr:MAG: protein translocase subunit SecF [Candidatus Moranbacteria bacterium]
MTLNSIRYRKIFYAISLLGVILSVSAISFWGLRLGIDFQGGTLMEIHFSKEISKEDIYNNVSSVAESVLVQPGNDNVFIVRYLAGDETINEKVREKLTEMDAENKIIRTDFFGSSVSKELTRKAIEATIVAIFLVAIFIAIAFRKVSRPLSSWQYGVGAMIALMHDIIITIGVFAILGEFYAIEVGIPFIAAILTILGYSVNDTIVVYDRIRENLLRHGMKESFENIINRSINETVARSINTSMTVLVVLFAIILLGGTSIQSFALALFIGVFAGTYSSIFVASALLVTSYHFQKKYTK